MTTESSPAEAGYLAGVAPEATPAPTAATPGAADANTPAAPSTAESKPDAKGPTSILEAVQAAAKATEAGGPSTPAGSPTDGKDPAAAAAAEAPKPDGKKDDLPPFHEHPRWKAMVRENQGLKSEAEGFRQLQGYMSKANLSSDEVNVGFNIMALMKNEPAKALEVLKPYVEALERFTGDKLPADIQAKVDQGFMAEEEARALVKANSRAAMAEDRAQQAAAQTRVQANNEIAGTLSRWETAWQRADADYQKVQPLVLKEIERRILAQGLPPNARAAVQLAEGALRDVRQHLSQFAPRPQPVTPKVGGSSSAAAPEPKSMREAMEQALRRGK